MAFLHLLDYYLILTVVSFLLAWRWGDWTNWKTYYPTVLFVVLANLIACLLTYNYPLWRLESPLLKTSGSDLIFSLAVFPPAILLFLCRFPDNLPKQIIHIMGWAASFVILEWIAYRTGFMSYQHGWNLWWSAAFDCIMFPIIWLHFKSPGMAWAVSWVVAILILSHFQIPFSSMR